MYLLPWGLLALFAVVLDAVSKQIVLANMRLFQSIPVIENVFHITFVKNTGASFGIFPGARWFFVAVTVILIAAIIIYTIKSREKDKLYLLSASFIVGGGIGNLIDRILTGEVVDFFDFCLIDFAVFNVADCFVVVGVILMLIYCLISDYKAKKLKNGGDTDGNI